MGGIGKGGEGGIAQGMEGKGNGEGKAAKGDRVGQGRGERGIKGIGKGKGLSLIHI